MSRRLPITLSDRQYDVLKKASKDQHSSIAELIRRAVDSEYLADARLADDLRSLEAGFGAWQRDASFDPAREARKLRRPLGPRPSRR